MHFLIGCAKEGGGKKENGGEKVKRFEASLPS
jgi:hypothetical protein